MGKHDMTILPPSRVPAAREIAKTWKQFTKLMAEIDRLREIHDDISDELSTLYRRKPGEKPPELSEAELPDDTQQQIARCEATLKDIDRPEHYEDDSDDDGDKVLRQEVIAKRLALMLGCVDTGPTSTEPEAFARMLVTHVYDANIGYLALLSGCKAIEQAQKPVKTIGYVLEVLQKHEQKWSSRLYKLNDLPRLARQLKGEIEQAQKKLPQEKAEVAIADVKREVFVAEGALQQAKVTLQRMRKEERDKEELISEAHQNYDDVVENWEEASEARKAADVKVGVAELALHSVQFALAKLEGREESYEVEMAAAHKAECALALREANYNLQSAHRIAVKDQLKAREAYEAVERSMFQAEMKQMCVDAAAMGLREAEEALAALKVQTLAIANSKSKANGHGTSEESDQQQEKE